MIRDTTNEEMVTNILVQKWTDRVMGGLFKEDVKIGRRQVPFLGNVPWEGAAFRGQEDKVGRTEVIFLIKPTVVKDRILFAESERVIDGIERARIGGCQRLFPFARTKLVASQMQKALAHMEEGHRGKALGVVNMPLTFELTLVVAMRLKETLTGERVFCLQTAS